MHDRSLTENIMSAVGLPDSSSWAEGSSSCVGMRNKALTNLRSEAAKHGLSLTDAWQRMLQCAAAADSVNSGNETLSNTHRVAIIAPEQFEPGIEKA